MKHFKRAWRLSRVTFRLGALFFCRGTNIFVSLWRRPLTEEGLGAPAPLRYHGDAMFEEDT